MSLIPLPNTLPAGSTWSPAVLNAYSKLDVIYRTAAAYIESNSLEAHRLRQYGMAIITDACPLLLLMEESAESESIPLAWLNSAAGQFSELLNLVDERWIIANGESTAGVHVPEPVSEQSRKTVGRPRKAIDEGVLRNSFQKGRKIPKTVLSCILGVDPKTLRRRLNELDIDTGFDDISDAELDNLLRQYRAQNPSGGRGYVTGWLRSAHNLRIQRRRVISAMARIDPLGHGMRQIRGKKTRRQQYHVPRPNALWHIDGHHKLIKWGIVIHGVVDGYSRKVTGLRASSSNSAPTVLEMFIEAVTEHGVPSRVRGDRGGENRDVAILMILLRGLNRASFMWGPSVFNTRIERLWVEVGERFVRKWRAFFVRLEKQHLMQKTNTSHRWLLHHLFLDAINDDCQSFAKEWNAHPISSAGNQSPNDLALVGALEHGVYIDDFADLPEAEIYNQLGFDVENEDNVSSDDDDGDESEDEAVSDISDMHDERLGFDPAIVIDRHIHHEPVAVPSGNCPLSAHALELFRTGLQLIIDSGDIPEGYGATEAELGRDGFCEQEEINVGIRNTAYAIELPADVWAPRMRLWAQGLFALETIIEMERPAQHAPPHRASPLILQPPSLSLSMPKRKGKGSGKGKKKASDDAATVLSSDAPSSPDIRRPSKLARTSGGIELLNLASSSASSGSGLRSFAQLCSSSQLHKATREAKTGLTKTRISATSKGKRAQKNDLDGSSDDEKPPFIVGTIVFFTVGVIQNAAPDVDSSALSALPPMYRLKTAADLKAMAIQTMKQYGLVKDSATGFPFRPTDDFNTVNRMLEDIFPELFGYLRASASVSDPDLSPWLICMKHRSTLSVVSSDAFPNGHDIISTTTRVYPRVKPENRTLYLVTRAAISTNTIVGWRARPALPVSADSTASGPSSHNRDDDNDDDNNGSDQHGSRHSDDSDSSDTDIHFPPAYQLRPRHPSTSTNLGGPSNAGNGSSDGEIDEVKDIMYISDSSDDDIAPSSAAQKDRTPTPPFLAPIIDKFSTSIDYSNPENPWN